MIWRHDQEIIDLAQGLRLGSVDELHGWFLGQLADWVVANGRPPVVWDEGVSEHLPKQAIVTTCRGYAAGAEAMAADYGIVLAPEQDLCLDHRAAEGGRELSAGPEGPGGVDRLL